MTVSPTKNAAHPTSPTKEAANTHASAIHNAQVVALEKAKAECDEQMIAKNFQGAYSTIVEAVKDAVAVYGKSALELVPYYLAMAEVGLELSHMHQVEEVLALCIWNIVKAAEEDVSNEPKTLGYRAQVCKLYGRYHSECEHFDEAVKQTANGAYYSSLVHGPEHIQTSTLYFTLGTVFQKMFRTEEALGMFDKVVEIWYKYLAAATAASASDKIDNSQHHHRQHAPEKLPNQERIHHEGVGILLHVLDTRSKVLGETHIATGEVQYTLGLLNAYMGDVISAKLTISKALAIYNDALGSLHPSTMDVQSVFDQL